MFKSHENQSKGNFWCFFFRDIYDFHADGAAILSEVQTLNFVVTHLLATRLCLVAAFSLISSTFTLLFASQAPGLLFSSVNTNVPKATQLYPVPFMSQLFLCSFHFLLSYRTPLVLVSMSSQSRLCRSTLLNVLLFGVCFLSSFGG